MGSRLYDIVYIHRELLTLSSLLSLLIFKAMNPKRAVLAANTPTEVAPVWPSVSGSVEPIGTAGVGELWSQPEGGEGCGDRSLPEGAGRSSWRSPQ